MNLGKYLEINNKDIRKTTLQENLKLLSKCNETKLYVKDNIIEKIFELINLNDNVYDWEIEQKENYYILYNDKPFRMLYSSVLKTNILWYIRKGCVWVK